jgi:hypothetical protein
VNWAGRKGRQKMHIIGLTHLERRYEENAVFSRARWCFRQCAWPTRRHARKNHWRARENSAREEKWQWLVIGLAGVNGWDLRFEV